MNEESLGRIEAVTFMLLAIILIILFSVHGRVTGHADAVRESIDAGAAYWSVDSKTGEKDLIYSSEFKSDKDDN